MRIAFLADPESGNSFYRARAPLAVLERERNHRVRALATEGPVPIAGVEDVDVLLVHRYSDERAQQLVRAARAAGAGVVWDNDDDMASMPKSVVTYKHFGGYAGQQRRREVQRIFRDADLVTAPSRSLTERFAEMGAARTAVVENHLLEEVLNPDRRPHAGFTIGWIAGLEHRVDVERLPIEQTLQRLLDERPDVNVITIGVKLDLRSERYRHHKAVLRQDLSGHAAEFDVAIAPLSDLEFNRARSNVKLKEYAAGGAPWLASPIGPYAGMGEQQGGRLVADDRWHEELSRLIDKPRERRKLAKRAAKWAGTQTITKHVQGWEANLQAAIAHAAARSSAVG